MSGVGLETVRPNGKVYRRRTPLTSKPVVWNDEWTIVMVYGTHDPEAARELAQAEWTRECDGELPEPVKEWIREVPWDALGLGYDRTIMSVSGDSRGSTPALRYGGDR